MVPDVASHNVEETIARLTPAVTASFRSRFLLAHKISRRFLVRIGLRHLERVLQLRIVERGQRFQRFDADPAGKFGFRAFADAKVERTGAPFCSDPSPPFFPIAPAKPRTRPSPTSPWRRTAARSRPARSVAEIGWRSTTNFGASSSCSARTRFTPARVRYRKSGGNFAFAEFEPGSQTIGFRIFCSRSRQCSDAVEAIADRKRLQFAGGVAERGHVAGDCRPVVCVQGGEIFQPIRHVRSGGPGEFDIGTA